MTSEIDGGPGWHVSPTTLRPVLDDEATFRAASATDPALEVLVALWSGDPDLAAKLLGPLIDADPTSWRLQAISADVIRDRGDTSSAIMILETLVSMNEYTPHEALLAQRLGEAQFTAGDYPSAAARFRRAFDLRVATDADASLLSSSRQTLDRALELVPGALAHVRAWGWGVVFLHDPVGGEIPDVDPDVPVTVSPLGLCLLVRHASDYDWAAGEEGPALVTIHLDRPSTFARPRRPVVVDAVLETPSRSLSLGDAEGEILLPAPGARTRVVISHDDAEWSDPPEVWIDLYPAG